MRCTSSAAALYCWSRVTNRGWPGSVAFVAAGDDHRFVDIDEDLDVLVFWSPARHRLAPNAG